GWFAASCRHDPTGREETGMSDQQGEQSLDGLFAERLDRGKLLKRAAAAGAALGLAPWVATSRAYASERTIKIGLVSPLTGSLSSFGETDAYTVQQMRRLFSKGLRVGKNTFPVEIIARDSQSSTSRCAKVAKSLILDHEIDYMMVNSTPLTTIPVSDVCEANRVPCMASMVPWQAWFFGRNGNPAKPFKWTYQFFWGLEAIIAVFLHMLSPVPTTNLRGPLHPTHPPP